MAREHPVLVIDDDMALRRVLVEQLVQNGEFEPTEAASLAQADMLLNGAHARFDVILLDVNLPDGDGRDYCKTLRGRGIKTPIIMLTGHIEEGDVVSGLDAGANDYITKPFRLNELLARMRAQMRAFEGSEDAVFMIGPYIFRPSAKQLQDAENNRKIRLTDKESAILKFLYRAEGKSVSRHVLLNEVWGYNAAVTTHTLETHIYRLRQKIESDPAISQLLLTEGGGYRLNVDGGAQAPQA